MALARHCERQANLLDNFHAPQNTQAKFCIDTDSVFLKPIEAVDITFAYSATTHVLSIFQKLYNHPLAWKNVFAPVGWIGVPATDRCKEGTLDEWIRKFIEHDFFTTITEWRLVGLFLYILDGMMIGDYALTLK